MNITSEKFDQIGGKDVTAYTLKNSNGISMTCINYGCIITKLITPDKEGNFENIVLGFDSLKDYHNYSSYFGAVVGRVAGRIKDGEFELDGKKYKLAKNDGNNHLHGGERGFDQVIWNATPFKAEGKVGVEFTYLSPDGEEGYPGNLELSVTYELNNSDELTIFYGAFTDKKTIVNITNHSYFNLSGNLKCHILNHKLQIESDEFLELNNDLLPTGKFIRVDNTVFDFRKGREIVEGAQSADPQNVLAGNGYDHPFLLREDSSGVKIVLKDSQSGRMLRMETNEPCVVLYTGNQLTDNFEIRGVRSKKYGALCLETQGLPDAVNHENFKSIVLEKGQEYSRYTKYKFSV
ncbi:aldose epimerase family protein [Alkalihalophilus lindianensis]|uniref:Aldose 1-epimerase n=1 Tax=Alkalihalophilus lindianensis TaxID=1630542 RepID=A0ABU3XCM5_9BACI|nr:aldose epimerase family protein [Alkalihalophilus lindianensis]MDV2685640.1 aldose epimerase family protein [Alkalihalophilus lindianensis]